MNIISLTDWHVPYEDERAINASITLCKKVQPEIIIIHEIHDFYQLSRFDKNPERTENLQDEIDRAGKYLWALRKYCPKSRIILLNSNHLDRLRKFLWSDGKALSSLRSLKIENLLELKEYGIEYKEDFEYKGVIFKHGNVVRQFSGQSAKGELDREGVSGVSGHTHRAGIYFQNKRGGEYFWMESGCLCDLNPEYVKGTPNWQQAITMVTFNGVNIHPQIFPIINGTIMYGNTLIK